MTEQPKDAQTPEWLQKLKNNAPPEGVNDPVRLVAKNFYKPKDLIAGSINEKGIVDLPVPYSIRQLNRFVPLSIPHSINGSANRFNPRWVSEEGSPSIFNAKVYWLTPDALPKYLPEHEAQERLIARVNKCAEVLSERFKIPIEAKVVLPTFQFLEQTQHQVPAAIVFATSPDKANVLSGAVNRELIREFDQSVEQTRQFKDIASVRRQVMHDRKFDLSSLINQAGPEDQQADPARQYALDEVSASSTNGEGQIIKTNKNGQFSFKGPKGKRSSIPTDEFQLTSSPTQGLLITVNSDFGTSEEFDVILSKLCDYFSKEFGYNYTFARRQNEDGSLGIVFATDTADAVEALKLVQSEILESRAKQQRLKVDWQGILKDRGLSDRSRGK